MAVYEADCGWEEKWGHWQKKIDTGDGIGVDKIYAWKLNYEKHCKSGC